MEVGVVELEGTEEPKTFSTVKRASVMGAVLKELGGWGVIPNIPFDGESVFAVYVAVFATPPLIMENGLLEGDDEVELNENREWDWGCG